MDIINNNKECARRWHVGISQILPVSTLSNKEGFLLSLIQKFVILNSWK